MTGEKVIQSNSISSNDKIVEEAARLAKELHLGQTDKAGIDYFRSHLTTVSKAGSDWKERVVGYLHDVAEDTTCSVEQVMQMLKQRCGDLLQKEDAKDIEMALELLNSQTALSREVYIARFKHSKLACRVKLNDLTHNMDLSRIPHPTAKDFIRIERYKKEYLQVKGYLE